MLKGYLHVVKSVAFLPNSKQVVSGLWDNIVWLWDIIIGAALLMLENYLGIVNSMAFLPNSKQVVSGSGNNIVWFWDIVIGAAL